MGKILSFQQINWLNTLVIASKIYSGWTVHFRQHFHAPVRTSASVLEDAKQEHRLSCVRGLLYEVHTQRTLTMRWYYWYTIAHNTTHRYNSYWYWYYAVKLKSLGWRTAAWPRTSCFSTSGLNWEGWVVCGGQSTAVLRMRRWVHCTSDGWTR